jgi:anti-sigma B factor antagonist
MSSTASRRYVEETLPCVTVSRRHGRNAASVVALRGELDAAALSSLAESFDDAITRDDSDVVIDLAGVDFIGAAWIGAFVRSRADLLAQDRVLTLRAPSRVARRLLDLCGLSYLVEPDALTDVRRREPLDAPRS